MAKEQERKLPASAIPSTSLAVVSELPTGYPNGVAVLFDHQPIAVMLDFVQPEIAGWRSRRDGRKAGLDEAGAGLTREPLFHLTRRLIVRDCGGASLEGQSHLEGVLDYFALVTFFGFALFSLLPVDWRDENTARGHVACMALSLMTISLYVMMR